jgi:hypothetical protein
VSDCAGLKFHLLHFAGINHIPKQKGFEFTKEAVKLLTY